MSIETFNSMNVSEKKLFGNNIENNNIFGQNNNKLEKEVQDILNEEVQLMDREEFSTNLQELNKAIRSLLFHKIDMPSLSSNKTILNNLSFVYNYLLYADNAEDIYMVNSFLI